MNANYKNESSQSACETMMRELAAAKEAVLNDFRSSLVEPVLRAAVNEAEALAFQTPYPELVFPVLAEEKAAAARLWARHQAAVRTREPWSMAA